MTKNIDINIFANSKDLFEFAAKDFSERANAAVNVKGVFSVVLSGGDTPKSFFDTLTNVEYYKENIPWPHILFFFSDERYVPADDPESNYHTAWEHLFSKVPINPENVYRIPTELSDPKKAAQDYEATLRKVFRIKDDDFPPFDLVYLGLGANGHTASLMPESDIVMHSLNPSLPDKSHQLTAALFVSELHMYRITLTVPAINNAKNIIFLVTGTNKATAVWEVLEGHADPKHFPAQLIHCIQGETMWYLDQAAARKLTRE